MKIKIISIQRHEQKEVISLEAEYLKRVKRYADIQICNIKTKIEADEKQKTLKMEEKLLLKELPENALWIVLDERGKQMTNKLLSQQLSGYMNQGIKEICFIVGGPQGVSENIKNKSRFMWSLSDLTFPHRLVRLLLIEALYRSFDIINKGPYHKD